jgi:hypothetical protein
MLTKGIVEKVITPYKVKVRLPIFDAIEGTRNATETNELSEAIICSLPNSSNLVNIGDIVIIGFEDNDTSKPIVLGHLLKESTSKSLVNLKLGSLTVEGSTNLNENTYIGDIKPNELKSLLNIKSNIQGQIDNNSTSITKINNRIKNTSYEPLQYFTYRGAMYEPLYNKTGLLTEQTIATALPFINGSHSYTAHTKIYAPTSSGTTGQILTAVSPEMLYGGDGWNNSPNGVPVWKNITDAGIAKYNCKHGTGTKISTYIKSGAID